MYYVAVFTHKSLVTNSCIACSDKNPINFKNLDPNQYEISQGLLITTIVPGCVHIGINKGSIEVNAIFATDFNRAGMSPVIPEVRSTCNSQWL